MQQILKTKKNLTFIFLSIILWIIFLLWVTFFCVKFFDGSRRDTQEMQSFSFGIDEFLSKNKGDILTSPFPFPLAREILKWKNPERERIPFNVVIFNDKWKILKEYINGRFDDKEEILEFFGKKNHTWILQEDDFIFQFIPFEKNKKILVFKPLRYPVWDFLFDIFLFLFVMWIFSLPLYFVVFYFVNKTLEPVEENLKDMQDFVHNAGHELKTPLSVMHGNLQIAKELKSYDDTLYREMVSEVEKMNQLIEWLVELSNISTWSEVSTFLVFDEIQDIVHTFDKKLKEENIECFVEKLSESKLKANKGYFYILFSNLFLNAIKYNSAPWKIHILVKKSSFVIQDTWSGIDKQFFEKIFERFFKIDSSRNSSGFWIGLSLVKKVAEIYDWKIVVKSEKGIGTTFEVFF